jgi:solute carrier family 35 protein F5
VEDTVWGDFLALLSAVMYGVYCTALRVMSPSDDVVSMPLMFGYMGLFNGVIFLPVLLYLVATDAPSLAGLSLLITGWVIIKGIFDNVLSDYFWARAVVLTSPTVATLGLALTIPIGFTTDFLLHGDVPGWLSISGAVMVVGGFLLISCQGYLCKENLRNAPSSVYSA